MVAILCKSLFRSGRCDGSRADSDARARRRILGDRGPADERDGHGRGDPARFVHVLCRPAGADDGSDDAAGRGSGSPETRPCQRWSAHRAAIRRVVPGRLGTPGRRRVCVVPAARAFRGRHGHDRGRCLRVHAAQAALPPALPGERPFWIRVRALLRRLEHRTDADAGGAGRHERHLDGRDRGPRPRPEAPARENRHRRAAGASDRRTGNPDRHPPTSVPGLTPPM